MTSLTSTTRSTCNVYDWHHVQMQRLAGEGLTVLVPPDANKRGGARPGWDGGLYAFMRRVLSTDHAKALYRKRQATVEPVFGRMKFNRGFDRFLRRGRSAVRSEWRLFGESHNLLKLHSHRIVATGPETARAAKRRAATTPSDSRRRNPVRCRTLFATATSGRSSLALRTCSSSLPSVRSTSSAALACTREGERTAGARSDCHLPELHGKHYPSRPC
jgi:hypothetical protein